MLIAFNKPFNVLCKFTDAKGRPTLADYIDVPNVYPAGRLDMDSEGLLLLTDDGSLQSRLSHPKYAKKKVYWAQVEGEPDDQALESLRRGVSIKGGPTRPAGAARMEVPSIWDRDPPVRFRKSVPTAWIRLTITEGRNRQVRRMTAAVGHPTLRLIRVQIAELGLEDLQPGQWRKVPTPSL